MGFAEWHTHVENEHCQKKMGPGCEGFQDCGTTDDQYDELKKKCIAMDPVYPEDWCVWLGGGDWESRLYPCYGIGPSKYCARSPVGKCLIVTGLCCLAHNVFLSSCMNRLRHLIYV